MAPGCITEASPLLLEPAPRGRHAPLPPPQRRRPVVRGRRSAHPHPPLGGRHHHPLHVLRVRPRRRGYCPLPRVRPFFSPRWQCPPTPLHRPHRPPTCMCRPFRSRIHRNKPQAAIPNWPGLDEMNLASALGSPNPCRGPQIPASPAGSRDPLPAAPRQAPVPAVTVAHRIPALQQTPRRGPSPAHQRQGGKGFLLMAGL